MPSEQSIKHFKKSLSNFFFNAFEQISNKTTRMLANDFADGVSNRLEIRGLNEAKDENSFRLIKEISDSITVNEQEGLQASPYVKIPIDDQNLVLFLEYGTGITGRYASGGNPDAFRAGWQYAINEENWSYIRNPVDIKRGKGFKFVRTNKSFISKEDVTPLIWHSKKEYIYRDKTWVTRKPYTRKDGRFVRGSRYLRQSKRAGQVKIYEKDYVYDNWVWSQGIHALKFIYDTKSIFKKQLKKITLYNGELSSGGKYYLKDSPNAKRMRMNIRAGITEGEISTTMQYGKARAFGEKTGAESLLIELK